MTAVADLGWVVAAVILAWLGALGFMIGAAFWAHRESEVSAGFSWFLWILAVTVPIVILAIASDQLIVLSITGRWVW